MKIILIILIQFSILLPSLFSQTGNILYSSYSDTLENQKINYNADSIYSYIEANKHLIDFSDCNICKSRAHILSRMIEKKFNGINVYKVWLIADCKRLSQKEKYKYKQNVYLNLAGKCSNWVYHVAPALLINGDTIVFDPSTQIKPVSIKEWAYKIIPQNGSAYLIIKDKSYYLYPESKDDYFIDETDNWETGDVKMKDEKYLRSIDEILFVKYGYFEPWKFNYFLSEILKLVD